MDGGDGATLLEYRGGDGVILLTGGGEGATRLLSIGGEGANPVRASDLGIFKVCL